MYEPYSYRRDSSVPDFPDDRPIIVFDGHCIFCSGWVAIVLRKDRTSRYRLLPAQSALGEAIYKHYGLSYTDYETNILIENGLPWLKSEGSIRMAEGIGAPWSFSSVFRILPLRIRDSLYDFVARNRFRIAGRRKICYAPPPECRARFLA